MPSPRRPDHRGPAVVERRPRLTPAETTQVRGLLAAAERADGTPPVSEQGVLQLTAGAAAQTHLLAVADEQVVGYGSLVPSDDPAGAAALVGELVVAPDARGRGSGRALVEAALAARGPRALRLWMHGDLPAARHLAEDLGLRRVRELLTLHTRLGTLPALPEVPGTRVRAFRPGEDEEAWLAVNARAFASHPEQGSMTLDDVLAREREPWFDPAGLLLVEDTSSGELLASHWTKTTPSPRPEEAGPRGEVYVVAVDPPAQGRGLGHLVTLAGLHHLAGRGVRDVDLYVESDNVRAVATYRRLGFERSGADVLVEAPARGPGS
ncbi:mycothiol synthase [Pseudokineococcus sp. 1T1Z-3]|uniref:mycothiol synthase n=1 Tax=Pseudokineococcus sp. 1T1Z-3 TaxID=3132745 RepID=UPI0030966714